MSNDDEEIYQEHVLDHYEDPYHRGTCEGATHEHEDDNPLCGDVVSIQLRMPDERVEEAWFDGDGCVISQASASMLIELMEGKSLEEVQRYSADEMLALFGPQLTPNRQKCCLLPWRVLQQAIFSRTGGEDDAGNHFGGPDLGEES